MSDASVILGTVAHQAPLSMGLFRQEHWSGLLFPSPGDLHNPGIKPESPVCPALQVDSLPTEPSGKLFSYTVFLNASAHVIISYRSITYLLSFIYMLSKCTASISEISAC